MSLTKDSSTFKKTRPAFANIYWFPLAALYAAIILPWSIAGQMGWWPAPAGLHYAWGHGHEMLFGFALAVVAGYTSGPQPKKEAFTMIGLWILARITFLFWPASLVASLCNLIFVFSMVWKIAPVFLKTAKKWRNKSVGFILIGIALTVAAFHAANQAFEPSQRLLVFLLEGVLLLSTLMFFMGGRMIAPAITGHLQKSQDYILEARVQPNFEGAVLILLIIALLLNLLPFTVRPILLAIVLILAASLTLTRMLRWQFWRCLDRPDLVALMLGYSWLIIGSLLAALSLITNILPINQALHAITVGALGTLTLSVMARSRMHRCLRDPNVYPWVYFLNILIATATIIRLSINWLPYSKALMIASACWSLAYLGLFALLIWLSAIDNGWIKREKKPLMVNL